VRNELIAKGMIYSPAHGDTAFTVPLFDGFMKRIMSELPAMTVTVEAQSKPFRFFEIDIRCASSKIAEHGRSSEI